MKQVTPLAVESGPSQTGSCVLSLYDADGGICLPIIIGRHEAQSILLAKSGAKPQRPMTHSLLVNVMETFGLTLTHASIDRMSEGIFYATLHLSDGFNSKDIDSRATDAVTLAILCNAPIFAADLLLEECGVRMEQPAASKAPASRDELMRRLHECEAAEDYEKAAEIQALLDQLDTDPTNPTDSL